MRQGPLGGTLQPLDAGLAVERVVLAINVLGLALERPGLLRRRQLLDGLRHDAIPVRRQPLGRLDGVCERNRATERPNRTVAGRPVLRVLQRPPASDDLGSVVQVDLVAARGQMRLQGRPDVPLGDGEHDDLVIGEQVLRDSPRER